MLPRSLAAAAAALLLAPGLAACSDPAEPASSTCPITVDDAWVKAADSGMTAGFGTLTNSSSSPVTITGASSPATTSMELHEVVDSDGDMAMQPVPGGLAVPPSGSLTLEPGGYHLMLMDLTGPIEPGEDVSFTLACSTGGTVDFTAQAKAFPGAEEEYSGDDTAGSDSHSSASSSS